MGWPQMRQGLSSPTRRFWGGGCVPLFTRSLSAGDGARLEALRPGGGTRPDGDRGFPRRGEGLTIPGNGGYYTGFPNQAEEKAYRMVKVQVKSNEPLEKALRRLRKICNNEGFTRELKRKSNYEKPSERRRRKERERLKTIRLANKS